MTLHEIAEALRKVAYDLDEASRRWDGNDKHVEALNRTINSLAFRARTSEDALAIANKKLERKRPKRRAAKRAKR